MQTIISLLIILSAMNTQVLFDARSNTEADGSSWKIVNDNVMGGRSTGTYSINTDGTVVFEGRISLANNGGFASLRFDPGSMDIENYSTVALLVKGHGKRFQFRVKADQRDAHSYLTYFETTDGWQEVEIPLQDLYPAYRGRKLNRPNFSGGKLEEIGFLFGNKKAEDFRLEIRRIALR
jgi:hypothetical protein